MPPNREQQQQPAPSNVQRGPDGRITSVGPARILATPVQRNGETWQGLRQVGPDTWAAPPPAQIRLQGGDRADPPQRPATGWWRGEPPSEPEQATARPVSPDELPTAMEVPPHAPRPSVTLRIE